MKIYPKPLTEIIETLQSLPAVGPRTAERYALALKDWPKARLTKLAESITALAAHLSACELCFAATLKTRRCEICRDPRRDRGLLCVVERESDLGAFEKTGAYPGRYLILGGLLSPTRRNSRVIERLRVLKSRQPKPTEIIMALNATPTGEATALAVQRLFKGQKIKITRLGRGLPTGSDVSYADEATLKSALKHREALA